VLLDAAYDASLRDLRDNWAPVTSLVVFAVGFTTAAVALVAHTLIPTMPWAEAIALGAVVAPPDAVAATAVLRPLRPPHRILNILEGESLLNDASALMIFRLAVGAVSAKGFSIAAVAPTFLLAAVAGSLIVGPALGWLVFRLMERVKHMPTAIILQFVSTFGVWMLADGVGLSGVLTMVCYAITVARTSPERTPARARIPSYAVEQVVGQDEAVIAISKALRRSRADLKDLRRPIGSFIVMGPTGVGKTFLARSLAEFMFGEADALIQIDMSERSVRSDAEAG